MKKIFLVALTIRVIYVIIIYFFYIAKTGIPFEFNAGDAWGYHITSNELVDWFFKGWLDYYFLHTIPENGISDTGWELTLALIYLLTFRSIIMVRIVNALVSSWMVIFIYRIAKRNFNEQAARISAIMAMLLPAFIYFSGLHLKETFMIFLLMAFMDQADELLHSRCFTLINILRVVLLGTSLFFFRTVLAAAAWFSLISAFLLSSEKLMSHYHRIIIVSWLVVATAFLFSGRILNEVSDYMGASKSNQTQRYQFFSTRQGANQLAHYGKTAVFIPIIIPAPFPTLVNIPEQQNQMMTNGDLFTRNIYVFFVFVAFYVLFKKKQLRKTLLLSVFLASYLLILANSGFALSPRFHLPALPFFLLFAGYGITQTTRNMASYYFLYIIGISVFIVAWNWFKLAGRSLV